ncbi:DNA-binding response OmpR family regulator [Flavobacterium sp. PL12]
MDGFVFLKELQNGSYINLKSQPIIAVTGRGDLEIDHYKKAGFTTVIRKPYTPKALLSTIKAIRNNTIIPIKFDLEKNHANGKKSYSLKALKSFLSDDKSALNEILETFMSSTNESIVLLDYAVTKSNRKEIKSISHKINPMFKQIKAFEISNLLDQLELEDLKLEEIEEKVTSLKTKITALFALLEKEIT